MNTLETVIQLKKCEQYKVQEPSAVAFFSLSTTQYKELP